MELTKTDKLFAYEAFARAVRDKAAQLKAEAGDELLKAYETQGTTQQRSPYFGKDAGTFSVVVKSEQPATLTYEYVQNLELFGDEFIEWLRKTVQDYPYEVLEFIELHYSEFARYWFDKTSECPDGIVRKPIEQQAVPEHVEGVRLALKKPDETILPRILGEPDLRMALFGTSDVLMLGDGNE